MPILGNYIVRTILCYTALVMLVLLALGALFLFIGQQDDIGTGGYTATQALLFVALNLPSYLFQLKLTRYGLLSVAGIVSLLLGSLMLFEGEAPETRLAWHVLLPSLVVISAFFTAVALLVFRSQVSKPTTGSAGLVGEIGLVKKSLEPEGKVFVHGELWNAFSRKPLKEGVRVRVVNVTGLKLEVEPTEPERLGQ